MPSVNLVPIEKFGDEPSSKMANATYSKRKLPIEKFGFYTMYSRQWSMPNGDTILLCLRLDFC